MTTVISGSEAYQLFEMLREMTLVNKAAGQRRVRERSTSAQ